MRPMTKQWLLLGGVLVVCLGTFLAIAFAIGGGG